MDGLGRGVQEIMLSLIGVAFIALLINKADGAVKVVNASGRMFAGLLGVVTLQPDYSKLFD